MQSKHFSKIVISLFFTVLLTAGLGCKGLTPEEQAAIRPVNLTYWTVFGDTQVLKDLALEYKKVRPYVNINIRKVRYEEFDTLFLNALADDVAPDVVSIHTRELPKYQLRLAEMPSSIKMANVNVTGNYNKQTDVAFETVQLPTVSSIKRSYVTTVAEDVVAGRGDIYGLPLSIDTLAIYYNKDLLDRAGIATPPTTWEEFTEAVKKTTVRNGQGDILQAGVPMGTGSNIDNAPDILAMLFLQKGLTVTDGSSVGFANQLNRLGVDHPAFEVVRFYTDFARSGRDVYSWNGDQENALEAFVRNRAAFYIGFAYDRARIQAQAPQMNMDIIPLPQLNPAEPANVANYWMESVVEKSSNQDAAWDFLAFITSQQSVQAYTDATGLPSPYRVHIASQIEDPLLAPFVEQLLNAENWYQGRDVENANNALRDLVDTYLEPIPDGINEQEWQVNLLNTAASVMRQTL